MVQDAKDSQDARTGSSLSSSSSQSTVEASQSTNSQLPPILFKNTAVTFSLESSTLCTISKPRKRYPHMAIYRRLRKVLRQSSQKREERNTHFFSFSKWRHKDSIPAYCAWTSFYCHILQRTAKPSSSWQIHDMAGWEHNRYDRSRARQETKYRRSRVVWGVGRKKKKKKAL